MRELNTYIVYSLSNHCNVMLSYRVATIQLIGFTCSLLLLTLASLYMHWWLIVSDLIRGPTPICQWMGQYLSIFLSYMYGLAKAAHVKVKRWRSVILFNYFIYNLSATNIVMLRSLINLVSTLYYIVFGYSYIQGWCFNDFSIRQNITKTSFGESSSLANCC